MCEKMCLKVKFSCALNVFNTQEKKMSLIMLNELQIYSSDKHDINYVSRGTNKIII
jgi:hypothetical protein